MTLKNGHWKFLPRKSNFLGEIPWKKSTLFTRIHNPPDFKPDWRRWLKIWCSTATIGLDLQMQLWFRSGNYSATVNLSVNCLHARLPVSYYCSSFFSFSSIFKLWGSGSRSSTSFHVHIVQLYCMPPCNSSIIFGLSRMALHRCTWLPRRIIQKSLNFFWPMGLIKPFLQR